MILRVLGAYTSTCAENMGSEIPQSIFLIKLLQNRFGLGYAQEACVVGAFAGARDLIA